MGPPEAYHVGSEKRGTVKKTAKRSAHVIMPLYRLNEMFLSRAKNWARRVTYSEAARNVRIRPILSQVGICNLRRSGHGRTSIATSVTKLGML
jgi:hypothetical protein